MSIERTTGLILKTIHKIIEFGIVILAWVGLLSTIAVLSPVLILRLVVSHLKTFGPDLYKIVSPFDNIFAIDDIYTNPIANAVCSSLHKGNIDIESFRRHFMERVVGVKQSDGEIKHVKLRQYPYKWMGFMFWRWEKNFDIADHVYYYEMESENSKSSKVSQKQIKEVESELMTKPFVKKRSPWEVLVIRNVQSDSDEEHLFIFRWHHSIYDGYSFIKNFWMPLISLDPTIKLEQFMATPSKVQKKRGLEQILAKLKMISVLPYEIVRNSFDIQDKNFWRNPERKLGNKYLYFLSDRIPMKLLNEVKEIHHVGLTAVIYSAFTAGIRKAMITQKGKVPDYIHSVLPFPLPGHPDELVNYFSLGYLRLPVGESDPITRLRLIQDNLDKWKTSLIPLMPYYFGSLASCLFPALTRFFITKFTSTAVGSCFPGPKNKCSILGHEAVDIYFSIGSCLDHVPVILSTLSYADGLRMKIALNENILENQLDVDEIQTTIEKEFHLLKNCSRVGN